MSDQMQIVENQDELHLFAEVVRRKLRSLDPAIERQGAEKGPKRLSKCMRVRQTTRTGAGGPTR
jgi:hypothetical protein